MPETTGVTCVAGLKFIRYRLGYMYFPVNLTKFFKTAFFIEHLQAITSITISFNTPLCVCMQHQELHFGLDIDLNNGWCPQKRHKYLKTMLKTF